MISVIDTTLDKPHTHDWRCARKCRCGAQVSHEAPRLQRMVCRACAARVADFTPLVPVEALRRPEP